MPMKKQITVLVLVAFLNCFPDRSLAWGHTGHMIVAQIALSQLTPKAKTEVERLIQVQIQPLTVHVVHDGQVAVFPRTSTFITAACWADDIKNNSNRECHFFDIPFSPDGTIP